MSPEQKGVFSYFDGSKGTFCDALDVYCRFVEACDGDPDAVLSAAADPKEPDRESPPERLGRIRAKMRLIAAARAAFKMAPIDPATGAGETSEAVENALYAWLEWMEKKSAKVERVPTSPPATAQPCSPCQSQTSSASGSTSPAKTRAAVPPSREPSPATRPTAPGART